MLPPFLKTVYHTGHSVPWCEPGRPGRRLSAAATIPLHHIIHIKAHTLNRFSRTYVNKSTLSLSIPLHKVTGCCPDLDLHAGEPKKILKDDNLY